MQWIFGIFFGIGLGGMIYVKTKKVPRIFCGALTWPARLDSGWIVRQILLFGSVWFLVYFALLTIKFAVEYNQDENSCNEDPSDEPSFYYDYLGWATLGACVCIFFSDAIMAMVVTTAIGVAIGVILGPCKCPDPWCTGVKFVAVLVIMLVLNLLLQCIFERITFFLAPLAADLAVSFCAVMSLCIVINGFSYWQLNRKQLWIPLLVLFLLAVSRFIFAIMLEYCVCCIDNAYIDNLAGFLASVSPDHSHLDPKKDWDQEMESIAEDPGERGEKATQMMHRLLEVMKRTNGTNGQRR